MMTKVSPHPTSGEPERIEGGRVSATFFSVLRVQQIIGRAFTPEEDRAAGPPLVILSHHYWVSHFNSDRNVVDRTLRIDGIAHSIIGVLPAGFQFLGVPVDVLAVPHGRRRDIFPSSVRRGARYLTVIGRLKQGVGINQAQASLALLDARYRRDYPGNNDLDVSVLRHAPAAAVGHPQPSSESFCRLGRGQLPFS